MVEQLRAAKVGVRCGEEQVPALLFADDRVILGEGEEELRRGLGVLEEWCSEWAMKVNADKCGVIHMVHVRGRATAVGGAECLAMEV